MSRAVLRLFAFGLLACSGPAPTQAPAGAVIAGEGVAIDGAFVQRVAAARACSADEAAKALREDALLATAATREGALPAASTDALRRRALGRRYAVDLADRARAAPLGAEDLAAFRAARWLRLDRPVGRRAVHALVPFPESKGPKKEPAPPPVVSDDMRRFADELREHLEQVLREPGPTDVTALEARFQKGARTTADFGLFKAKTESLPPVARDGRVVDEESGTFDAAFAEAVWAAPFGAEPPAARLTPVFRTAFGLHVALVVEETAPYRPADDEVIAAYHEEILQLRAKKSLDETLKHLRASTPIEIASSADELLLRAVRATTGE